MQIAGLDRPLSWVSRFSDAERRDGKRPALSESSLSEDRFHSANGGIKPHKGMRALLAGLAMAVPLAGVGAGAARAQSEDPGTTGIWENDVKVAYIEHDIEGGHARLVEETLMDYSGGTLRRDEIVKAEHPDVMLPLTEEQMQSHSLDREALELHIQSNYGYSPPLAKAMTDLIEGYYLFSDVLEKTVAENPDVKVISASIGYAPILYLYPDYMPPEVREMGNEGKQAFMTLLMKAYDEDPMLMRARTHYRRTVYNIFEQGIHVVIAAGNHGQRDLDQYKRMYDIDLPPVSGLNTLCFSSMVICVGAMDQSGTPRDRSDDRMAGFSSIGGEVNGTEYYPMLLAPGVNVPIEFDDGTTRRWSGTSAATPFTAALVAHMFSLDASPSASKIKPILRAASIDNPELPRTHEGYGTIDADQALAYAAREEDVPSRPLPDAGEIG